MLNTHAYFFLLGMIVVSAAAIGAFFFRYWRRTRDQLFLSFSVAFWLFAATWAGLAAMHHNTESTPLIYLMRLLGFGCIIAGIVGKNRAAKRGRPASG